MPSAAPGGPAAAAAMQESLEGAGRVIERLLQEERAHPDLSDLLNVLAHSKTEKWGVVLRSGEKMGSTAGEEG